MFVRMDNYNIVLKDGPVPVIDGGERCTNEGLKISYENDVTYRRIQF